MVKETKPQKCAVPKPIPVYYNRGNKDSLFTRKCKSMRPRLRMKNLNLIETTCVDVTLLMECRRRSGSLVLEVGKVEQKQGQKGDGNL